MESANHPDKSNQTREPVFTVAVEQSFANFRILRLIEYAVICVLVVVGGILLYHLLKWLTDHVSLQFIVVRLLIMESLPILFTGLLFVCFSRGIRFLFGQRRSTGRTAKIITYRFYDDHFEYESGKRCRSMEYRRLKKISRWMDYLILHIKGSLPRILPMPAFDSAYQMLQLESFIKEKLK